MHLRPSSSPSAPSSSSPIPWFSDFVGVAYRYYDLRMNVVPLFTDKKEPNSLWYDVIHWWPDPSVRIRFLETGDKYWFIMGSDSRKPDSNMAFFKELAKSGNYERFKRGHDGTAYLRLGVYTVRTLADAKKGTVCGCGHEAQDHDEGDGDACLFIGCGCKRFSSSEVTLLKKKKTVTDIAFLSDNEIKDDPLVWNCLYTNKIAAAERQDRSG